MKFRIFKQVPRLIFGKNSINRIDELLPEKKENDYYVYVIDDYFQNKGHVTNSLNFENKRSHNIFSLQQKKNLQLIKLIIIKK